MAFNLNGLTQVITRAGNLGASHGNRRERGRKREGEEKNTSDSHVLKGPAAF